MTYEKMTGEINLEELEVQAEEVTEASGHAWSCNPRYRFPDIWLVTLCL